MGQRFIVVLFALLCAVTGCNGCSSSSSQTQTGHERASVFPTTVPGTVVTVANTSALTGTEANLYLQRSGALAYVTGSRTYFSFDATSTSTSDGATVLGATINGTVASGGTPGRWVITSLVQGSLGSPLPLRVSGAQTLPLAPLVLVDTTSAGFAVVMPAAPLDGYTTVIKDAHGTWLTHALTVTGNAGQRVESPTAPGTYSSPGGSQVFAVAGASVTLLWANTEATWFIE